MNVILATRAEIGQHVQCGTYLRFFEIHSIVFAYPLKWMQVLSDLIYKSKNDINYGLKKYTSHLFVSEH